MYISQGLLTCEATRDTLHDNADLTDLTNFLVSTVHYVNDGVCTFGRLSVVELILHRALLSERAAVM